MHLLPNVFGQEEDWQNHCSAEHSVVASTHKTNPSELQQSHEFVLERLRKALRTFSVFSVENDKRI